MIVSTEDILATFADRMRRTPQPVQWHGEGDVYTHTRMVCDALYSLREYTELPEYQRNILLCAAMLHDIGKTVTTGEILGSIEAPNHAPAGSRMAREYLWRQFGICGTADNMHFREAVALLIRYHSFPPHAIDADDGTRRLHRIASNALLVPHFSIRMLCMLSRADMLGRICADKDDMLDRIALCEEMAKEEECFDTVYPFPDGHTRHAYLSGRDVWKGQTLHNDNWGTVYLMSGLPGTGKDTWIQRNLPDIPMISLDDIRRTNRISPEANQGQVANMAKDIARGYLRRHIPFVWNATNITQTMRRQLVDLFETYGARVHIVYLETGRETQTARNASRRDAVPQHIIDSMLGKLVLPEAFEATNVEWLTV